MKKQRYSVWPRRSTASHARAGFTLVETLVAITILLVSIAGPLVLATKSLSSAVYARDQITAFYLAQEAIEMVRRERDHRWLDGSGWQTFRDTFSNCINDSANDNKACIIDGYNIFSNSVVACVGSCPALLYNSDAGFYSHFSGEESRFTRTVRLTTINDHEIAIEVIMSWTSGLLPFSFTLRENILNSFEGLLN